MEETWVRKVQINETEVEVSFFRRPFREGLEVEFEMNGELIHWAELGYGENHIVEKVKEFVALKGSEKVDSQKK